MIIDSSLFVKSNPATFYLYTEKQLLCLMHVNHVPFYG